MHAYMCVCLCIHTLDLISIFFQFIFILLKQVLDRHKIQGSGDVDKEKIEEANVTFVTPKLIEKETTKNYHDNEKETKMSREEDDSLEIIKEGNVNDLSQKSIGEGPIQIFEDNNKEAKKSIGEVSVLYIKRLTWFFFQNLNLFT